MAKYLLERKLFQLTKSVDALRMPHEQQEGRQQQIQCSYSDRQGMKRKRSRDGVSMGTATAAEEEDEIIRPSSLDGAAPCQHRTSTTTTTSFIRIATWSFLLLFCHQLPAATVTASNIDNHHDHDGPHNPLGAASSSVFQSSSGIQPRLVGGTPASSHHRDSFVVWGGCSATLIHPDLALTAAHCTTTDRSSRAVVGLSQATAVRTKNSHPQYESHNLRYDLAVIQLGGWFGDTTLVRLNQSSSNPPSSSSSTSSPVSSQSLSTDDLIILGLGKNDDDNGKKANNRQLLQGRVQYVSPDDCDDLWRQYGDPIDSTSMICSVSSTSSATTASGTGTVSANVCPGDSGSPLFDSRGLQVGVASSGQQSCETSDLPTVYARVSSGFDWITAQICELSQLPPKWCPRGGDQEGYREDLSLKSTLFRVDIYYDDFPEDTTWSINDATSEETMAMSRPVSEDSSLISTFVVLPDGLYTFSIMDSFRDGFRGRYQVVEVDDDGDNVQILLSGKEFFDIDFVEVQFTIGSGVDENVDSQTTDKTVPTTFTNISMTPTLDPKVPQPEITAAPKKSTTGCDDDSDDGIDEDGDSHDESEGSELTPLHSEEENDGQRESIPATSVDVTNDPAKSSAKETPTAPEAREPTDSEVDKENYGIVEDAEEEDDDDESDNDDSSGDCYLRRRLEDESEDESPTEAPIEFEVEDESDDDSPIEVPTETEVENTDVPTVAPTEFDMVDTDPPFEFETSTPTPAPQEDLTLTPVETTIEPSTSPSVGPVDETTEPTTEPTACSTIAEIVCDSGRFGALCELLVETGLIEALSDLDDSFTLFAPTNFRALQEVLPELPVDVVEFILLDHFVNGEVFLEDLACDAKLVMVNALDTETVCDEFFVISFQVGIGNTPLNAPRFIEEDIIACNGVVHVVNNVILPAPVEDLISSAAVESPTDEPPAEPTALVGPSAPMEPSASPTTLSTALLTVSPAPTGTSRPANEDLTHEPSTSPTPLSSPIPATTSTPSAATWSPTGAPSQLATATFPSEFPSEFPTEFPSEFPTELPSEFPTAFPTEVPSDMPSDIPSESPTVMETDSPTDPPTKSLSPTDSPQPTQNPSEETPSPSAAASTPPSVSPKPSEFPTVPSPSDMPSDVPTTAETNLPTESPTLELVPSDEPSQTPTSSPTGTNMSSPSAEFPSDVPSSVPSESLTESPEPTVSPGPSVSPTLAPTRTHSPSASPTEIFVTFLLGVDLNILDDPSAISWRIFNLETGEQVIGYREGWYTTTGPQFVGPVLLRNGVYEFELERADVDAGAAVEFFEVNILTGGLETIGALVLDEQDEATIATVTFELTM